MKIIQRGAEAILYLEEREGQKVLVKDRVPKGYRIPELDEKIRSQRTRREGNLLLKAKRSGVWTPNVLETKESRIIMELIRGKKVKDSLNSMLKSQRMLVYRLIGEAAAKLHENGITHGDLTTSNMIFVGHHMINGSKPLIKRERRRSIYKEGRLYIIDFGLGKISGKVEDQAMDLFLLYEALKSTHLRLLKEAWENILKAYKQNYPKSNEVLKRILKIERRRRYKGE